MLPVIEKRTYIILPSYLNLPNGEYYPMSCGRLIAQATHAVQNLSTRTDFDRWTDHTTVVLKVIDSKQLAFVRDQVLGREPYISWAQFQDTNCEVYGTDTPILTAVAFHCSRKKGKSLFHTLEGWTCDGVNQERQS